MARAFEETLPDLLIRDLPLPEPLRVPKGASIRETIEAMQSRRRPCVLVCDGRKVVGIFTERDILRALSQDFDAPGQPVAHWMTRDPVRVDVGVSVQQALDLMLSKGFRHLPVEEGGEVVGMVSMRDLSQAIAEPD